MCVFFFFQAEDGIRDLTVTGVQTCALPIYVPGRARTGLPRGRARSAGDARHAQRRVRLHLRRPLPGDARPDRVRRLRRLRRRAAAVGGAEAAHRRAGAAAMKAVVVGGGLAGLAAALELTEGGHDVTLVEARPTVGGAVQTLPERAGDPSPPPDNGQHIALGCFTEYLRFLARVGEGGSYLRTRLALPVLDERARAAVIKPSLRALLRYAHLPV